MVGHVAGRDERRRTDGKRIAARRPGSHPCVRGKVAEQRDGRQAHALEFLHVRCPRNAIGPRARDCDLLVETGQGRIESTREPQRPKGESTFGVADVIQHLANAPFARAVPVQRFLL